MLELWELKGLKRWDVRCLCMQKIGIGEHLLNFGRILVINVGRDVLLWNSEVHFGRAT